MTDRIYLDHAATTPLDERVLEAMLPYLRDHWGNPSSLYGEAQEARRGLEGARRSIAEVLGFKPLELVLTSGGSESDNLALRGAAYAARRQGHGEQIITTAIEHHAVLHEAERLQEEGFRVTYLGVDGEGFIDLQDLEDAVTDDTALVSIMYVNNEVGTIESIEEAVRVVKAKNPRTVFHTDAVQNRRAGTENVAGVVGMAEALELAHEELDARNAHARELRDRLLRGIPERIPHVHVTGPEDLSKRAANNFSACFEYIEGEAILIALDLAGVAASSGSACTSGSLEPSHVLTALGVPEDLARGSLRLTVGTDNAPEQIEHVLEILPGIVSRIRSLSPAWPERERV
ncbi:MAG: cysteine desulfurase [Chloroflexi bacterium]|nr:MAG: cysteine desulfurase [Chloroflexota bacterium]